MYQQYAQNVIARMARDGKLSQEFLSNPEAVQRLEMSLVTERERIERISEAGRLAGRDRLATAHIVAGTPVAEAIAQIGPPRPHLVGGNVDLSGDDEAPIGDHQPICRAGKPGAHEVGSDKFLY